MQVAFDLGNVLVKIDDSMFGYAYHTTCKTNQDYLLFLESIHSFLDTGLLTIKQALRNTYGPAIYPHEKKLLNAWNNIVTPHYKMLKLVDHLKEQGVEVAILSNIGYTHADLIRTKYPEIFDGCKLHLSCELGVRKPAKLYFQSFLNENPQFKGCSYVDDLQKNLAMGFRCGLKPHKFNLHMFDRLSKFGQDKAIDDIKKIVLCGASA